jgi:hypothetical protein
MMTIIVTLAKNIKSQVSFWLTSLYFNNGRTGIDGRIICC